jgi:hypothetical protein
MLVNCPKCGFSQPKDRFCANCGVDMDAFQPAPPSLGKRLLGNPFFHLAVILSLALLIVYYIRTQPEQFGLEKNNSLKAGPFVLQQKHMRDDSEENTVPSTLPPATTNPEGTSSTIVSVKSAELENTTVAAPAKIGSLKIKATYAEVDRNTLEALKQESAGSGLYSDMGDFKAGALSDISKKLLKERGITVLQKVEKTFDATAPSQQWFVGKHAENELDLGLTTAISVKQNDDNSYHIELEILRSLKESREAPPIKRAYPINSFDLAPGMGWMITMNLPRQIEQFEPGSLAPDGFLRIFRSAQFKGRMSEFTLFIEFDTPAATPTAGKTRNEP